MPTVTDLFEKARTHERLEQLQAAREHDLLPYFRLIEGEAGPLMEVEGKERVMLGSNNYLGLTGHPRVKEAARQALETYGTGLTGSRLLNGTTPLHLELEREIAAWMGTGDAIVFTTGYQANVGCLSGCGRSATTVSTSSRRCSSARPRTAAECSWWWTASTRWRATYVTCRRSSSSAVSTAPG